MPRRNGHDKVNTEVARRIKALRLSKGLSQTELGRGIGVTFQQVQKYENARNRIGPDRLQRIADLFGVPIASFYPSMDTPGTPPPVMPKVVNRTAAKMLRDFNVLDARLQRRVADLVADMVTGTVNSRRRLE